VSSLRLAGVGTYAEGWSDDELDETDDEPDPLLSATGFLLAGTNRPSRGVPIHVTPPHRPSCWPGGGVHYMERIQFVIPLILSSAVPT